jgi:RNA recognition motif-containing protein
MMMAKISEIEDTNKKRPCYYDDNEDNLCGSSVSLAKRNRASPVFRSNAIWNIDGKEDHTIWIRNLPPGTTCDDIESFLEESLKGNECIGTTTTTTTTTTSRRIVFCSVFPPSSTSPFQGTALVEFQEKSDVQLLCSMLIKRVNGYNLSFVPWMDRLKTDAFKISMPELMELNGLSCLRKELKKLSYNRKDCILVKNLYRHLKKIDLITMFETRLDASTRIEKATIVPPGGRAIIQFFNTKMVEKAILCLGHEFEICHIKPWSEIVSTIQENLRELHHFDLYQDSYKQQDQSDLPENSTTSVSVDGSEKIRSDIILIQDYERILAKKEAAFQQLTENNEALEMKHIEIMSENNRLVTKCESLEKERDEIKDHLNESIKEHQRKDEALKNARMELEDFYSERKLAKDYVDAYHDENLFAKTAGGSNSVDAAHLEEPTETRKLLKSTQTALEMVLNAKMMTEIEVEKLTHCTKELQQTQLHHCNEIELLKQKNDELQTQYDLVISTKEALTKDFEIAMNMKTQAEYALATVRSQHKSFKMEHKTALNELLSVKSTRALNAYDAQGFHGTYLQEEVRRLTSLSQQQQDTIQKWNAEKSKLKSQVKKLKIQNGALKTKLELAEKGSTEEKQDEKNTQTHNNFSC